MTSEEELDLQRKVAIRSMSSEKLVEHIYDTLPRSGPNFLRAEMAKAELLRRQTEAINQFNRSSTLLARVMILLTVVLGVITILQLFVSFGKFR